MDFFTELSENLEWWNIVPHESVDSDKDDDDFVITSSDDHQLGHSSFRLISDDYEDVIDERDLLEQLRSLSKL